MRPLNRTRSGLAAFAMAAALLTTPAVTLYASDHIDGPTLAHDKGSDINDTYAFLDPADNTKVVLIMTINPFLISSEIIGQAIFDHNIRYRFEIENTGDATPDKFIDVTFSRGVGRETDQVATIILADGRTFTGRTTIGLQGDTPPPFIVTDSQGASFYAGATDDPFFLDNTAANRWVLSSFKTPGFPDKSVFQRGLVNENGRDTYAGFNALAIAVRVPASMLKGAGNVIGVNSVTQRRILQIVRRDGQVTSSGTYITVDRDGNPLVNNGLVPPARKDEYNAASTADDAAGRFEADIVKGLRQLGTNQQFIDMILAAVVKNGDILRLDLTVPNSGPGGGNNANGGFGKMGGRRLQDDVVDGTFTLINNGVPLSDNVSKNDDTFRDVFPYLSFPIQPNPKGKDSVDDRTRL